MKLLDIHSHILPGIDDGPKSVEASVTIARLYLEQGIREVIVTPHFEEGLYFNTRDKILQKTEEFQKELDKRELDLKLYPGSEVMITPSIIELIDAKKIMTFNDENKYILLEIPLSQQPLYIEDVIYEIKLRGLTPVIAHPERYKVISSPILEENILQINLCSLQGYYGRRIKERAEKIIASKSSSEIYYGTDIHSSPEKMEPSENFYKLVKNFELLKYII